MSVYRDTNTEVVFEHPFEGPLTAVVYRNGIEILRAVELTPVDGRYTLPLTFRETQFDGTLEVRWTGLDGVIPFERTQYVEVRTPLASLSRMRVLFQDTNWQDVDLAELENNVRLSIEAYTGQKFGYEVGTKFVTGTGEKKISLPMRLAKLNSISGGPAGYFGISGDGYSLYIHNKNLLYTKEAPPEDYADNKVWTGTGLSGGVIYVPDSYWRQFRVGTTYGIDGEWGWTAVPDDVQEAALLLANDYACGDNLYRDRYLEAIKSGDWNLTFNLGAYRGTGNARADALLEKYRRTNMVVI